MNGDRAVGLFFLLSAWLLLGGVGAFWWLPAALGAKSPIPWDYGALCLLMQWVWVFNRWPQLGTRRFFQGTPTLKLQLLLLGAISALFALGFAIVA
jgi:hypothetical protein